MSIGWRFGPARTGVRPPVSGGFLLPAAGPMRSLLRMARWNDAVVALIDEQGITQVELARMAGLHPDTVSHVVHGGH